jgi:hypothetical protein
LRARAMKASTLAWSSGRSAGRRSFRALRASMPSGSSVSSSSTGSEAPDQDTDEVCRKQEIEPPLGCAFRDNIEGIQHRPLFEIHLMVEADDSGPDRVNAWAVLRRRWPAPFRR